MFSRRKCEKQLIGFLTSIYRERISHVVRSFAQRILRQELLHCIPGKTRHVRWLLRCTPCFRDGSFSTESVGFACDVMSALPQKQPMSRPGALCLAGRQCRRGTV